MACRLNKFGEERSGKENGRRYAAAWDGCLENGSVERYAQLFPEYGFDPFEIFCHEGEFFLDVGNAFEERIERSQKPLVLLVQLGEAPVDGAETVVDSVQNDGSLFRQQLLDLRDEGRFPGTTDGFWLWHARGY